MVPWAARGSEEKGAVEAVLCPRGALTESGGEHPARGLPAPGLPPMALPLPLLPALGDACLPLDLLPLPLMAVVVGDAIAAGMVTSQKESTTPMSQSMEGRGRNAEMSVSCTCAPR